MCSEHEGQNWPTVGTRVRVFSPGTNNEGEGIFLGPNPDGSLPTIAYIAVWFRKGFMADKYKEVEGSERWPGTVDVGGCSPWCFEPIETTTEENA